jgi:hypothetical protein
VIHARATQIIQGLADLLAEVRVVEVFFSGIAYPGSTVTLLRDGQFLAATVSGPDAKFEIDVKGVAPGTFVYTLQSQDSNNIYSKVYSFPVAVTAGVGTVISGIFLPPTIDTDKSQVRRGDPIMILGSSAPNARIDLVVHSQQEIVETTHSDKNGIWQYQLDTIMLEYGDHNATARWKLATSMSPLSAEAPFVVGLKSVSKQIGGSSSNQTQAGKRCAAIADLNCDGRVDAIDFSILAYWYKRPNPPANVDLSHDGKIDARDFSILAYYWGRHI